MLMFCLLDKNQVFLLLMVSIAKMLCMHWQKCHLLCAENSQLVTLTASQLSVTSH